MIRAEVAAILRDAATHPVDDRPYAIAAAARALSPPPSLVEVDALAAAANPQRGWRRPDPARAAWAANEIARIAYDGRLEEFAGDLPGALALSRYFVDPETRDRLFADLLRQPGRPAVWRSGAEVARILAEVRDAPLRNDLADEIAGRIRWLQDERHSLDDFAAIVDVVPNLRLRNRMILRFIEYRAATFPPERLASLVDRIDLEPEPNLRNEARRAYAFAPRETPLTYPQLTLILRQTTDGLIRYQICDRFVRATPLLTPGQLRELEPYLPSDYRETLEHTFATSH